MSFLPVVALFDVESHVREFVNILRSPTNAADSKTYISSRLFFRRICDVWGDEYREIVEQAGDERMPLSPKSNRLQIPEDRHWNHVRT